MKWITIQTVLAVHDRQITEHGGSFGVRDMTLLQSALARPKQRKQYGDGDIFDFAAEYAYGIAKNHPFIDGNKRTAYTTMLVFLILNGEDNHAPSTEHVLMTVDLAVGRIHRDRFAAWLRDNSAPPA